MACSEPEAVLVPGGLLAPRLVHAPRQLSSGSADGAIFEGGSHIVSGGTSGLGLLTGRWIAERGAQAVVFASRGGRLSDGAESEWAHVLASGATAVVARCDTSELSHVKRMVASLVAAHPYAGVWHAAGVLADGVLPRQSCVTCARVYAPKAHGAWSLHSTSASSPLRACALFSSVAALLGGAGQANYSAANQCLDALAAHRVTRGCRSVSVQWGAWAEMGMAAGGAVHARLQASGFDLIGLSEGLAALQVAVEGQCGVSVLAVVPARWEVVLGDGGIGMGSAFLSLLAPRRVGTRAGHVPVARARAGERVESTDSKAGREPREGTRARALAVQSPLAACPPARYTRAARAAH